MEASASAFLRYIQKTLADASRLTPSLRKDDVVEISIDEVDAGHIGEHALKRLQGIAKAQSKPSGPNKGADSEIWPISVVVVPRLYGLRPTHGEANKTYPRIVAPLLLMAKLGRDGRLLPDASTGTSAVVARDLLEPNRLSVCIGTVSDADEAYAGERDAPQTWAELMRQGIELLQAVTKVPFEELEIDHYTRMEHGVVLVSGSVPATFAILRLLEHLQVETAPSIPLFEELVRKADDVPLLSVKQQLTASARHWAQMEGDYPLSPSQREALAHHLSPDVGSRILAVDGPPGTGKTTILLSVVASLWVQRAVEGGEPPLIVATSTNNQAVTNILHASWKVKEKESPFRGRWLDGINSYGLYLPAKSKRSEFKFPVHEMRDTGGKAEFDARHFEDKVVLAQAKTAFVNRFCLANGAGDGVDLTKAVALLQSAIKEKVTVVERAVASLADLLELTGGDFLSGDVLRGCIDAIARERAYAETGLESATNGLRSARSLAEAWSTHLADEPWWIRFLAAVGLTGRRQERDRVFGAKSGRSHEAIVGSAFDHPLARPQFEQFIDTAIRDARRLEAEAKSLVRALEQKQRRLDDAIGALRALVAEEEITLEAVQGALDQGARHTAFQLTTHYWEGRFLLHLEELLSRSDSVQDTKSPTRLLAQYRRLAMLHPCFVATLYTLPDKFMAWTYKTESEPLLNAIDLLIVDEAGQVPPDVGAPAFALAKRAIVVGDVDQIEPVWLVPAHIDGANAVSSGVVPSEAELAAFREEKIDSANGSLMRLAQRSTPFAKYPQRGRGMFLSEHRRCWPEIIEMCNVLVYGGRLKPCRKDDGNRAVVPTVGYVHIPGNDRKRGGSRENPTEARAIARWIEQRRSSLLAAYQEESLGKVVAVITPFSAQSRQVSQALNETLGAGHGITVGTVHALQGASQKVVIFSPTYGLGTDPGATFIDRSPSMLNVAISRAEDAFLIFGNMELFHPAGKHPCAVVGRMLFNGGKEVLDVPPELLVEGFSLANGRLIRTLSDHREVLQEAMRSARSTLVIVSPFLTESAISADGVEQAVATAVRRGVQVRVVTDEQFASNKDVYRRCVKRLSDAGALVRPARQRGVHSKMLLVDRSWLVVGSFNWLSAVRDSNHELSRHEASLRYDGPEAFEMISRSWRDFKELVRADGPMPA